MLLAFAGTVVSTEPTGWCLPMDVEFAIVVTLADSESISFMALMPPTPFVAPCLIITVVFSSVAFRLGNFPVL